MIKPQTNITKIIMIASLIILLLIILVWWTANNIDNHNNSKITKQNFPLVSAIPVKLVTASPQITIYGVVENQFVSTLQTTHHAMVKKVLVHAGAQVKHNALLILLDKSELEFILEQQQAKLQATDAKLKLLTVQHQHDKQKLQIEQKHLQLLKTAVTRQQKLAQDQLTSQALLDKAIIEVQKLDTQITNRKQQIASFDYQAAELTANMKQIAAEIKQTKLDLSRSEIRAPFAGHITQVHVSPGERARIGDSLIELYNQNTAEIHAQIPTKFISVVKQAWQQNRSIFAHNQSLNLKLKLCGFAAIQAANQAGNDAFFCFLNNQSIPPLKDTVVLQLDLPAVSQVIIVPQSAIYHNKLVYKITNQKLQAVPVKIIGNLIKDGQQQFIIQNQQLKPGELILTTNLPNIVDGMQVELIKNNHEQ